MGTTFFISRTFPRAQMGETVWPIWPFFGAAVGVLLAIRDVPALTLRF